MQILSMFKTPVLLIVLALGAASMLSACNTIEGMGEDTQAAGEATSETARDAEEEMEN